MKKNTLNTIKLLILFSPVLLLATPLSAVLAKDNPKQNTNNNFQGFFDFFSFNSKKAKNTPTPVPTTVAPTKSVNTITPNPVPTTVKSTATVTPKITPITATINPTTPMITTIVTPTPVLTSVVPLPLVNNTPAISSTPEVTSSSGSVLGSTNKVTSTNTNVYTTALPQNTAVITTAPVAAKASNTSATSNSGINPMSILGLVNPIYSSNSNYVATTLSQPVANNLYVSSAVSVIVGAFALIIGVLNKRFSTNLDVVT